MDVLQVARANLAATPASHVSGALLRSTATGSVSTGQGQSQPGVSGRLQVGCRHRPSPAGCGRHQEFVLGDHGDQVALGSSILFGCSFSQGGQRARRCQVRAGSENGNGNGAVPSNGAMPRESNGSAMPPTKEENSDEAEAPSFWEKDVAGAGLSLVSPDWLISLVKVFKSGGDSGIPVANAKLNDVEDLLGGALFLPLFKWMKESGPVYRLAAGPKDFVVISEPECAKHVLKDYKKYAKGLVSEVAEFLFGSGFATAEGELWSVRRRAVVPSLHRRYLELMVESVFLSCAEKLVADLQRVAPSGQAVDIESKFSQMTLDVIGKALFNYDFDALNKDSPVIQAVYVALKETESRSTDILPYWQIPLLCKLVPRQRKALAAVQVIRDTVDELLVKCKAMVEAEGERLSEEEYINSKDPSILRFLLASREEVSSMQLRDDLLSMLVAGHETTASVLTWTMYLLVQNPDALAKAREEVDRVLGGRRITFAETRELKYLTRCINESMRLYPHPPVLIRRAMVEDEWPGGYKIGPGQDIMISIYNIHHSPQVWDRAEDFIPERFDIDGPIPNESNTDFRYIPFSGGPRKCVGDQFAMLETIVSLATMLQHIELDLVPGQQIGMTTGATIHTTSGLYMTARERKRSPASDLDEEPLLVGA